SDSLRYQSTSASIDLSYWAYWPVFLILRRGLGDRNPLHASAVLSAPGVSELTLARDKFRLTINRSFRS
ncbi:MAG: hypothetical protein VW716_04385, partial [Gammaproteobacteria bacterium]